MNPVLIIRTEIINIIILLYLIVYNRRCKKYRKGKDDFIWFALLSIVHCIFGHVEGDRMIAAAAQTLRDSLKRADNIFRIGGDEFAAIYKGEKIIQVEKEIAY